MQDVSNLTSSQPSGENSASHLEEANPVQTISRAVFADKEFPNDWHVETIDSKTGDIFAAVFSGPDAEERAREYATWQESKDSGTQRRAA